MRPRWSRRIWVVTRAMKRYLPVVGLGLAGLTFILSGCESGYSDAVKYGVRTDPLVTSKQGGDDIGDPVTEPDRPGVLPIIKPDDVLRPENPLHTRHVQKDKDLFQTDKLRDPMLISASDRQAIDTALTEFFGTPAEPKVAGLEADEREKLKLDDKTLKEGSRLYRIHCVHCHGVPGDGRGPTARWISPHPRDFRQGLFKFMSVDQAKGLSDLPPRRDDLSRTIRNGLEGTAMPAFLLLDEQHLQDLVSYVIHLSLRGKTEFDVIASDFKFKANNGKIAVAAPDNIKNAAKDRFESAVEVWMKSQKPGAAIVVPDKYDWKFNKANPQNADDGEWQVWKGKDDEAKIKIRAAIAQAFFNDEEPKNADAKKILELRGEKTKEVNCKQCHEDYGRKAKFRFDRWGTLVRPNNFTAGVFRGGRRPADIYHRIHSGINGSGMTQFGQNLSPNSIWDMVDFVQALSYPAMRKKMGIAID